MIQEICRADSKMRINRARLFVRRSVHQPLNASVDDCARAHNAWLDGRIHRCARQPVIANFASRFSERDNLSVRRRVA